ncbi:hypothetical protein HKX48_000833 [Thoreauomyces humboldtii]|nr:hypothetical protein HKX48_000833 [Thoreauomyces humboldtii]
MSLPSVIQQTIANEWSTLTAKPWLFIPLWLAVIWFSSSAVHSVINPTRSTTTTHSPATPTKSQHHPHQPPPHRVYTASTYHARYKPVHHSFRYPLFYFGLDLDRGDVQLSEGGGGGGRWLVAWGRRAVFSVRCEDHLGGAKSPGRKEDDIGKDELARLKGRLLDVLEDMAVPRDSIGRVEFITTPRVFGYSFNPLSVYYCYATDSDPTTTPPALLAIVLEVNNTFGERHVYVCDHRNALKKGKLAGYPHGHELKRSFHVSPFNDRSGSYMAHFKDPREGRLDVLLHVTKYGKAREKEEEEDEGPGQAEKEDLWLTARVSGPSQPLTRSVALHLIATYPVTAFLTVPRILIQAWKLAYDRKMKVWQKPGQYHAAPDGRSLVRKEVVGFARWCADLVETHIARHVKRTGRPLVLRYPNGTTRSFLPPSSSSAPRDEQHTSPPVLTVTTPTFFVDLILTSTSPGTSLLKSYVRGDWTTASPHSLTAILSLFLAPPPHNVQMSPTGDPLSVDGFADVTVPDDAGSRWRVWKGRRVVELQRRVFGRVARWEVDPYGVAKRIVGYLEERTAAGHEERGREEDAAAADGDDGVDVGRRERDRLERFVRAVEGM